MTPSTEKHPVRVLHEKAMAYSEVEIIERCSGGDLAIRHAAAWQAYHLESQAADMTPPDAQPSHAILHRSAATLAVWCGNEAEAMRHVTEGLQHMANRGFRRELHDVVARIETGWFPNEVRPGQTFVKLPNSYIFHLATPDNRPLCGGGKAHGRSFEGYTPDSLILLCAKCKKDQAYLDAKGIKLS